MVKIGFDRQCMTPPLPIPLNGYAGERIAEKVHDDLYVRCLVFKYQEEYFVLAQCDCIAIDDKLLITADFLLRGVWGNI